MNLRSLTLVAVLFSLSVVAQAKPVTVQVKGMVCAFCAQGIEKKFKALSEVKTVKVSLETKKVDLETRDGQDVSDERIRAIVTDAGYEVLKIERAP